MKQEIENKQVAKAYNTWYSHVVTLPSTNQSCGCLISVIRQGNCQEEQNWGKKEKNKGNVS